jgi:hypothetical protein
VNSLQRGAIAAIVLAMIAVLAGCDLLVAPTPFGAPADSVDREDPPDPVAEPDPPADPDPTPDPTPDPDPDPSEGDSSTITISNPAVPTFVIDNGGVTLDRSVPDVWNLEATAGPGVTITAFDWLVNGTSLGSGQLFALSSTEPALELGANTLALFVLIDGAWYSSSFVFQMVEN